MKLKVRSKTGNKAEYRLTFHRKIMIATCACGAQFLVVRGKNPLNSALKVHIAEHKCEVKGTAKHIPAINY